MSNRTQPQTPAESVSFSSMIQRSRARPNLASSVAAAFLLAIYWPASLAAQTPSADPKFRSDSKSAKLSTAFFEAGLIPELRIEINKEQYRKLEANNRAYVLCNVTETLTNRGEKKETKLTDVGIKLKGAAGSFRPLNDRPALTLNPDKFNKGQEFHGLDKFHLANSVQDGSLLNELLCSHLFRQAGVPASRISHARVWLNNRDLGIYVFKEGFDPTFLKNYFEKPTGNLYDGGFCREINEPLEKDCGNGPNDHSDLKALIAACTVPDLAKRQIELEKRLDIDQFLTFAAMEMMTAHWDGYCRNRNNYRLYFNESNGKAIFIPHGMDQMFGDPNFPLFEVGGIVGQSVLQVPEFRQRYRKRLEELMPLFAPEKLNPIIDDVMVRLRPVLMTMNKNQANEYLGNMNGMKERVRQRYLGIQRILKLYVEPIRPKFNNNGELVLTGWIEAKQTDDAIHEVQELPGNKKALLLKVGPSKQCIASWRREIVLPAGRYELQALVKTDGVVARPDFDQRVSGAGLRVSGDKRSNSVAGTNDWKLQKHAFEVPQDGLPVILVAELRASAGTAMFDAASLKLVRLKN